MRQLSESDINELIGGGVNHGHYHDVTPTHQTLDQLQEQLHIVKVTGNYLAVSSDDIIIGDSTASSLTVTLPSVKWHKEFIVTKAASANSVTVNFADGSTCYGAGSWTLTQIGQAVRFKAYQGNWITV